MNSQGLPYHSDTFYHQYFLRDKKRPDEYYILGGNHLHMINFKERKWDNVAQGIYDFK